MNNNTKLLRCGENFLNTANGEIIKKSIAIPLLKKSMSAEGLNAFLALALDDEQSPYISDIIFDPAEPYGVIKRDNTSYWNSFKGFTQDTEKRGDISPILEHIEYILCNRTLNGELAYPYVIKWLAHMIQKPYEKPRVAIAFHSSAQQVGKGIIFKVLLGKLLGSMLKTTSNAEDIFGKHNSFCYGSLLTVLDEVGNEKKPNKSLVNTVITEKVICMKHKNNPQAQIPTYNRLIQLTNADRIQDVSEDDSRWIIIQCSDEARDFKQYFDRLAACIENCYYSFYEYLASMDISEFSPQADRIVTDILLDQIDLHKHPVDRFVEAVVNNQIPSLEIKVPQDKSFSQSIGATRLYNSFENWLVRESWGAVGDITRTKFGIKLANSRYVQKVKGNSGNAYRFRKR